MVTASSDKTARLWDVAVGKRVRCGRAPGRVWHAAFSPDGKLVVTASERQDRAAVGCGQWAGASGVVKGTRTG